jgi:hypothetical protein
MDSIKNINLDSIKSNIYIRGIVIFILALLVLHIIISGRKFYYYKTGTYTKLISGVKNAKEPLNIPANKLPNSEVGKEFTISLWVYVNDWGYNFSVPKHIFHLGDAKADSMSPGVWLYPKDNNLMVRMDKSGRNNGVSMNPITNPGVLTEKNDCDLINIPVQRWNHITLILANKTLDVYLNGRLNSSCAYNYIPLESSGNIYVNQFGGYDGSISELTHVNKALSAGEVYSLYSNGYEPINIFKKMWRMLPRFRINTDIQFSRD